MSRAALTKDTFSAEPFGVMRRLSDEMDRFFQGFGLPRAFGAPREGPWLPALESFTRDGTFVVRAELPGLTEKDVSVEIAGDVLTIKGERTHESDVTKDGTYTSERAYGRFMRSVGLPDGAVPSDTKASFKSGVLEITMPVTAPKTPEARKVEVTAG